ncbi:hypothetical protein RZ882_010210, partial [Clostridioides difficile]|nr:hypothetical protein [Clostridioides difficile]MDI6152228.1 hypothetical protein [Clostridioides difficile]MDK3394536.1 hypothetical protein [Clostridioides difficile]MDM9779748.1 hypothetical protein [Clostridioides difficile]MDV9261430.1 hypothetical protein [Clostridioides difficile]
RRNYGDSLWRISKTYFSMQNSMKQELCDFSHGRFRVTHPGFIDYSLIKSSSLIQERVYEHAMLCDKEVKIWLRRNNIELVDFRDLLKNF